MKHSEKMINLLKSNSRGFTLIELVLTVIAIGIFGAITANILGNASKVYESTLKKQKFVSEARHSFFRLNRDFNLQTWAMNDDISNPKSLNIESANGWQLQYDLQTNNNLRLNLIQHSNPVLLLKYFQKIHIIHHQMYCTMIIRITSLVIAIIPITLI